MADQLVRLKIINEATEGLPGALVKIFDSDYSLQAQGTTSEGPTPVAGVFETTLDGAPHPGKLYTVHVLNSVPRVDIRSQLAVVD